MGFSDNLQDEEFKVIEKFTCIICGKPKFNSVDEVRLELFLKKNRPKKEEEVLINCVKKMEGRVLPPCASVLQQKTNRTNLIAGKLLSSWTSHSPISNPLKCGWELSNGNWKVKWFEGGMSPNPVGTRTKNVRTKDVHKRTFIFGSIWKHGKMSESEHLMNPHPHSLVNSLI